MDLFNFVPPKNNRVPILVSVPHSGSSFPDELRDQYFNRVIDHPQDTDWYVDTLYSFVGDLGVSLISANFSRYVIDLNRTPDSKPMYNDGRFTSGLVPMKSFDLEPLMPETSLSTETIDSRLKNYYWPYYHKIQSTLDNFKQEFGHALLFDAHSIRNIVESIQEDPFPDLIIGDQKGRTADSKLSEATLSALKSSDYSVSHNQPFSGGHITRYFGKPKFDIHAIQLEMNQKLYMDEKNCEYVSSLAEEVREVLRPMLTSLITTLGAMK